MYFKKIITFMLVTVVATTSFILPAQAASKTKAPLDIQANAAFMIEASTGKVLYNKNGDKQLGIASMTKMVTEYLLMEAIKEGKIKWDDQLPISKSAYNVSQDNTLSNVPLRQDKTYSVRELTEAMSIYSANGATIAIAEKLANGDENKYINMMDKLAEKLELGPHNFVNSTGLSYEDIRGKTTQKDKGENELTARGVAKLSRALILDYPEILDFAKVEEKSFQAGTSDEIKMENWNWMLPGLINSDKNLPVDGLKTGTTDHAGMTFAGTAEKNGMRLITVIMNAKDKKNPKDEHSGIRFVETAKMMNYGFNNYDLISKGLGNQFKVNVYKGDKLTETLTTQKEPKFVVPKNAKVETAAKMTLKEDKTNSNGELVAPVAKGTVVGKAVVAANDPFNYGYLDNSEGVTIDVITDHDIEKAGFFLRSWRVTKDGLNVAKNYVFDGAKGWFK
ncbi:D-alanyl-D-alanine carboxypeptidase family protein [Brochothrix thermosphacta]|uniref:D-alanyl-D-alanine carboxypeptidase family protein n=1 Tax=Brochothrix thermosphacta TaxID=2756 RepID=UPI00265CA62C|nr:D-alanyl-D-alanine carboxypeptidase family protein [Brochothrix thermosphacta]WKK68972.1 D-alanyl-D-alanine carboxypeptidase family protein [Brochothrix thermosphacta]